MRVSRFFCKRAASSMAARRGFVILLSILLALPLIPLARASSQGSSGAAQRKAKLSEAEFVPGEVLVRFRPGSAVVAKSDRLSRMLPLRLQDGREIPVEVTSFGGSELVEGLRLARVPAEDTLRAVERLNARPDVEFAEPNYIWRRTALPNDTQFGDLWALKNTGQVGNNDLGCPGQPCPRPGFVGEDIEAQLAWNTTTGNRSVVVAVLDGGVDITHPDLQPNIWTNPGEVANNGLDDDSNGFIDDINGWDFHHDDKTVFDAENGDHHATHVAGTIGAVGNNGQGVTGINWQVSIMSVKVLGPNAGGVSDIIDGYNYVRTMKARGINVRVMNNSYGGPGFSQAAFLAIQQLNAAGILFVAAAGNDAQNNFSFPHFPSDFALPNIISVAATDRFGQMAVFSNFGARTVLMGAPGRGILSTVPAFFNEVGTITENGAKYAFFSGTSMATPHVAGGAALLLSQNPNISVQNLRGALVFSGDVLQSQQGQTTTGRRLNVAAALTSATESGGAADTTPPANPSNLQVTSVNGRNVTLQWTAPGDDGTSGTAADYEFTFLQFGGGRLILPTLIPPAVGGTTQTVFVTVPYLNQNGTIELRAYDNAGNFGVNSVSVFLGQNHLNDPYVSASNMGPQPLSTGGTSLNLNADDGFIENHQLPFGFPFYGQFRNAVTVSTNGALYFSRIPRDEENPTFGLDAFSSLQGLNGQTMIAGLWDDIRTDRPNGGVFVVQPDSTRVIYRWQAVTFERGEVPVNFEIELNNIGHIIFRYGAGQSPPTNTQLFSVVGISAGEPDAYIVSSHSAGTVPRELTNANVVSFTPRQIVPLTSFQFSQTSYSVAEHDRSVGIMVTRTGNTEAQHLVTFRAQGNPSTVSGGTQQQLTFIPGEGYKIAALDITDDLNAEPDENVNLSLEVLSSGTQLGPQSTATLTVIDDDTFPANSVGFMGPALQNVSEGDGKIDLTVTRTASSGGDLSQEAFVSYRTSSGTALDTKDYSLSSGSLHFLPGEASKNITVLISEDAFDEPDETFNVQLMFSLRTTVNTNSIVTVQIQDNDPQGVTTNPSDAPSSFVTQHYMDFLNRVPDAAGRDFWTNQISECGGNTQCTEVRRINVSAAFYISIEFQETGYLVYRTYKTAFGNLPSAQVPLKIHELIPDTQVIGRGVQVGVGDWVNQLEANKQAFFNEFVTRGRFKTALPPELSPAQFVYALNRNAGLVLTPAERDALVDQLTANNTTAGRASVLRQVAQNTTLRNNEFNKAFVLMQYFGYLRRNPNDPPDNNFDGWQFWLNKLNQFNGNFVEAEMVKAFIISTEYRQRFGP